MAENRTRHLRHRSVVALPLNNRYKWAYESNGSKHKLLLLSSSWRSLYTTTPASAMNVVVLRRSSTSPYSVRARHCISLEGFQRSSTTPIDTIWLCSHSARNINKQGQICGPQCIFPKYFNMHSKLYLAVYHMYGGMMHCLS